MADVNWPYTDERTIVNRRDIASQQGLNHALVTLLAQGHESAEGDDGELHSYSGDPNDTTGIPEDVRNEVAAAWVPFFDRAWPLVDDTGTCWAKSPQRMGEDWVLTGYRHGAGFWDRGEGVTGDILTDLAHEMPPPDVMFELYTEDDREVRFLS